MSWFHYIDALTSVANPGQRRGNQPIEPVRLEVPFIQQRIRTVDRSALAVVCLRLAL